MVRFLARRVLNYVVMLFLATSLTYFLASFFMDPRSNYLARNPRPPMASINASLTAANINDQTPLLERYWTWLTNIVLHWNWGLSPTQEPVAGAIATRIGASVQLVTLATVLGIVIGVGLGVHTAIRQYQWQDRVFGGISTFFLVVPTAVLALFVVIGAIYLNKALGFRLFYVTGLHSYDGNNWLLKLSDLGQHLILPTIVLTVITAVTYHLTQRTYLLDTMNADYVRTARAKGLPLNVAIRKHALRTSLIPTTVMVAFSIAGVFTGAVITETMFAINGLGKYFITTLVQNDINGSVAIAAFGGACTLVGALAADVAVSWLDPRVRIS
ncbi:ABC transporter permease [Xylanimonas ulmi]|uniref:Peptide/nickel transport system permease protein n=1 Tax=Xylanimonas ulmi TaxID=228973 RepID=A0A4Q7M4M3_9MICO|nr:ABC transporter permease [Xylanibacterium ulmi]RZS62544.1 peptide/nickel transport system permease protein [Xylanibacterium ulmi]